MAIKQTSVLVNARPTLRNNCFFRLFAATCDGTTASSSGTGGVIVDIDPMAVDFDLVSLWVDVR